MNLPSFLTFLFALTFAPLVHSSFVGLGDRHIYKPVCAYACRAILSNAPLACSGTGPPVGHSHGPPTSPECRASDKPFLTTLAFCIQQHCGDSVPVWELEKYWAEQVTGDFGATVPELGYQEALREIRDEPQEVYHGHGDVLDGSYLVDEKAYGVQATFMPVFEYVTEVQNQYTLILLVVGFGTPIILTLFTKLPGIPSLVEKVNPYLITPALIKSYHTQPLPYLLGNAPTIGQTAFVFMFLILNIVLSSINYRFAQPHPWGYDALGEKLAYVGYRTGDMAFALLPLVILLSGRNNILLWLTNWSHSTFMLLHRWVARIFALHTIIHSIVLLVAYKRSGMYVMDHSTPYWRWGIVGTVAVCAMLVFSLLYFRRLAYEAFLIFHIVAAVFVIVGSWYHVIYRFGLGASNEYWLYAASAVWAFDRLMRLYRVVANGLNRATVTEVGAHHVRIDIPGIRLDGRPGRHAYAYFPTLNPLKPWENHPFSISPTHLFRPAAPSSISPSVSSNAAGGDIEKSIATSTQLNTLTATTPAGVTLIVRKSAGMTKLLASHTGLLTLIDGPYRNESPTPILACDRVLLIAGGIGITGVLSYVAQHHNVKLVWSIKQEHEAVVGLVNNGGAVAKLKEKEILLGQRVNVAFYLEQEYELLERMERKGKLGVVVCGPGSLCDSVRDKVVGMQRRGASVELSVEAFSW